MTRLLLLRHAESEWNAQGRWQGLADSPLSDRGRRQARIVGDALATLNLGFTALAASDLQRARETAELLASALGWTGGIALDPALHEYDVGEWSGLTRVEIEARWPGALDDWRHGRLVATPGGETRDGFMARITAAIGRLSAAHAGATLVITHGGVIGALERALGGQTRRVPHLAGRWFEAGNGSLRALDLALFDYEDFGPTNRPPRATEAPDGEAAYSPSPIPTPHTTRFGAVASPREG